MAGLVTLARRCAQPGSPFEHARRMRRRNARGRGICGGQCFDEFHLVTFNSIAPRAHVAVRRDGRRQAASRRVWAFNQLRELQPGSRTSYNSPTTTTWTGTTTTPIALRRRRGHLDSQRADSGRSPPRKRGQWGGHPNEKQPRPMSFLGDLRAGVGGDSSVRVTGV